MNKKVVGACLLLLLASCAKNDNLSNLDQTRAQQTILSGDSVTWLDTKNKLNANFSELYGKVVSSLSLNGSVLSVNLVDTTHKDIDLVSLVGSGGGLADAPSDSKYYGRRNAAWAEIIPFAPSTLFADYGFDPTTKLDSSATAASATKLATARTIGGVSFDGTANINLPGVNQAGTQNTSGNAGTATALASTPTKCSAGYYPLGIDIYGNAQNCTLAGTGGGAGDIVYLTDCSGMGAGFCFDTNDNILCRSDGTTITCETPLSANLTTLLAAADYAAVRSQLGLVPGVNVQAYNANLTTWAGVIPGSGVAAFLATPSSANFFTMLTDENGSGKLVGDTGASLFSPKSVITTTGLTANNVYYRTSASGWALADANGSNTFPVRCYAISTTQCVEQGTLTVTAHGFTVGVDLFLSETAGAMTVTKPSTGGSFIEKLGWVYDANTIKFYPSPDIIGL